MGKRTQFGTLEEVLALSAEIEGVMPCLDFCHLHAREGRKILLRVYGYSLRSRGKSWKGRAFKYAYAYLRSRIWHERRKEASQLERIRLHYPELMRALKEFKVRGRVILKALCWNRMPLC